MSDQPSPDTPRESEPGGEQPARPAPEALPGPAPGPTGPPAAASRQSEPSYPDPAIPYVHGRDVVPIRVQPRKYENPIHQALFDEEDQVRKRIQELDREVLDLSAERRRLLQRIRHIHDALRPRSDGARGRRRRAVTHEEPLPPAADDAVQLIGRELRNVGVALLKEARRELTLRELHVVLHRVGYAVAHEHPAKALADALGHEADAGRVIRTKRATYKAAATAPSPGDEPPPGGEDALGEAVAPSEAPGDTPARGDEARGDDRPSAAVDTPNPRGGTGSIAGQAPKKEHGSYGGLPDW